MTPLTDTQLAEYETAIAAYQHHPPIGFACCSAHPAADAAAVLLDENRRLRAQAATARSHAFQDAETSIAAAIEREHAADRDNGGDWTPMANRRTGMYAAARIVRRLRETAPIAPAEEAETATPNRTLTDSEYNRAWHAVEGAAGEEGADPGTVLHAVLDRLGIDPPPAPPVHACPPDGSGITPCCSRTPFELPRTDRMATDPALVTCTGAVSSG